MMVRLTYRLRKDHTILHVEDIEMGTAAMRGREETEVSLIISLYVEQHAAHHEWYDERLHTLHWAIIDQSGIGLTYMPSEPRGDE